MSSSQSLCVLCRDADFGSMLRNAYHDDSFPTSYDAHRDTTRQVPRTWRYIVQNAIYCAFCRLTYLQIESSRRSIRQDGNVPKPDPFAQLADDAGNELEISVVVTCIGKFQKNSAYCLGFHNGTYYDMTHEKLMARGLQMRATEGRLGAGWGRVREAVDRANEERALNPKTETWEVEHYLKKDLGLAYQSCLGGRPVRKDHIDFDLCKEWFSSCRKHHYVCRSRVPSMRRIGSRRPARVIDIKNGCLVSVFPRTAEYAALSYVWGPMTPELQLTKQTEGDLTEPGFVTETNMKLGRTIRDAIEFCRKVDLPYLWIDSLCIPQDGVKTDPEIFRMAEIYSQAAATLVALSASSFADPLPGVQPGSRSPEPQHEGTVKGFRLISCYPSLVSEIENSVWFTRGWTLQEAAFSQRLLFFTTSQLFFACRRTLFCEESVWEVPDAQASWAGATSKEARIRDILLFGSEDTYIPGMFYRLIESYSLRNLGKPSDILNACDAVIKWYKSDKINGSRSLFGLPVDNFAFGLGWKPVNGHAPDKRRPGFPSWTWAGWIGPIRWPADLISFNRERDDESVEQSFNVEVYSDREFARKLSAGREIGWGASGLIEDGLEMDKELASKSRKRVTPRDYFLPHNHPWFEFVTTTTHVCVRREARPRKEPGRLPSFDILGKSGLTIGELQCDPTWRAQQPDELEFIVIAAAKLRKTTHPLYHHNGISDEDMGAYPQAPRKSVLDEYLRDVEEWKGINSRDRFVVDLMCIQRLPDGVAERVQVCHYISLERWMELDPHEALIRLG
ncbi:hypothetical protein ACJ41O_012027 [Fusarium nematophilum]